MILALACAAQFMVVLDIAIVNVALPSIQQDLDVSPSTLQWVVIAYGLLLGGFLLLGGRMADLLGRRRMFLTGVTVFSAASLVAGIAQSSAVLIAARGFQGFGAALVAPAALSILAVNFADGQERNRALGIFGAVGGTSASVGVIASGLLTDGPGWRWVFFINIPVGIVLITLATVFLAADRGARGDRNFDVAGATTVTGGLLLLVYGLNRGAEDGWTATTTLSLFAAAALLLASFVRIEARSPRAARPGGSGEEPHTCGGQPLGVLHLQRVLLVHLPGHAAHAAGPRILTDEDRSRLAVDVRDGVHRHPQLPAPGS